MKGCKTFELMKHKNTMIVLNKEADTDTRGQQFNISIFKGRKFKTKIANSYEEIIDIIKKAFEGG